jgi:hypothetical protein
MIRDDAHDGDQGRRDDSETTRKKTNYRPCVDDTSEVDVEYFDDDDDGVGVWTSKTMWSMRMRTNEGSCSRTTTTKTPALATFQVVDGNHD